MIDFVPDPNEIAADIARALYSSRVRNASIYLSTGVTYPNGVGVTVRVDPGRDGFVVSDDGYAALIAEGMGALSVLARAAVGVARRAAISFEKGRFVLSGVERSELPVVVSLVANASSRAMERVTSSLERPKLRHSRETFDKRLTEAFGKTVRFDLDFEGATGHAWTFDAGVQEGGRITRLFELVSPTTQGVAIANMKISDAQAVMHPPQITAALTDYDATAPTLRALLSASGGSVISANDDIAVYKLHAVS
ncbi:MAG: hypothetical protein ACRYGP_03390 [Janthinobacterium lividum]